MAEKETKKTPAKKTTTKKVEETRTITGLEEKYEVILVYIFSILGFIFSLMKDKRISKSMKFNYNQAGTMWLVSIILNVVLNFGGVFINPLKFMSYPISIILFVFSLVAMIKAYNGENYKIPVIADISKSIWGE